MAEGTRTKNGERVWVVKREDDAEGQGLRIKFLRPAEDDEVQGHGFKYSGLSPEDEDTEGQGYRHGLEPEGEDDTVGHPRIRFLSPEPIDAEQGLFLAVVDTEEDVTGEGGRLPVGNTEEDSEGQMRRRP